MGLDPDCLFCKIARREIPSEVVHEDGTMLAFRDINPQAPTHILIIPKCHVPTLNDLEEQHQTLIGRMFLLAAQLAADEGIAQTGYRCVFNCMGGAGQSVFHIHMHLLGGRPLHWPPG